MHHGEIHRAVNCPLPTKKRDVSNSIINIFFPHFKECTVNDLGSDNIGPSKLSNFSYIPFRAIGMAVPLFACQKIEAQDYRGSYQSQSFRDFASRYAHVFLNGYPLIFISFKFQVST